MFCSIIGRSNEITYFENKFSNWIGWLNFFKKWRFNLSEPNWKTLSVTSGILTFVIIFGAMFILSDAANGFNLSHLSIGLKVIILGFISIFGFIFLLTLMRSWTGNKLTTMTFVKTILALIAVGVFLSISHYLRGL